MTRGLILASASPYRKQLLSRLSIPFTVSARDVDETPFAEEKPNTLVARLAKKKAWSCATDCPRSSLVIGSDQVGALDDMILGKPGNFDGAVRQLQMMNGKDVCFFTAVHLVDVASGKEVSFLDTTKVQFRQLSKQSILSYVKKEQPFSSCGSFQVEGLGISLVQSIQSHDPTALIGLPLIKLSEQLTLFGFSPLDSAY